MYFYLVILAGVLAGIGYIAILRGKVKKLKSMFKIEQELNTKLTLEIEQRDHAIKALEGAFKNENEKKKKIHTGSNADKFAASLDVLSNKAGS